MLTIQYLSIMLYTYSLVYNFVVCDWIDYNFSLEKDTGLNRRFVLYGDVFQTLSYSDE